MPSSAANGSHCHKSTTFNSVTKTWWILQKKWAISIPTTNWQISCKRSWTKVSGLIPSKPSRKCVKQIKMVIYASRITNRVPAMSARFAINKFSAATKSTVITPVKISASYWLISPWKISSATVSASLEPAAT